MAEEPDIRDLRRGDDDAWQQAFKLLYPCAFHASNNFGFSDNEREDIAIEALEKLLPQVDGIKTFQELKPLIVTISRCHAVSVYRKKHAGKRDGNKEISIHATIDDDGHTVGDGIALPDQNHLLELSEILEHCLENVTDRARNLLRGHFYEGLSYKELAGKHDMPMGTVCVSISRALKLLLPCIKQNS